jgi:hypothetical protein
MQSEWRALEKAIWEVEKNNIIIAPQSTGLLIASLFLPGLWAIDFTAMSLYWVAGRVPKMMTK